MPTVVLASSLTRWLTAEPGSGVHDRSLSVAGSTVRQVLDALFEQYPTLRGYICDEHGAMRHHVVAFLNGNAVTDKATLGEPVSEGDELYLFQALSGG